MAIEQTASAVTLALRPRYDSSSAVRPEKVGAWPRACIFPHRLEDKRKSHVLCCNCIRCWRLNDRFLETQLVWLVSSKTLSWTGGTGYGSTVCPVRLGLSQAVIGTENLALLDADKGKYYGLDDTSLRIWQLLENPMSAPEFCEKLLQEFDVCRRLSCAGAGIHQPIDPRGSCDPSRASS